MSIFQEATTSHQELLLDLTTTDTKTVAISCTQMKKDSMKLVCRIELTADYAETRD